MGTCREESRSSAGYTRPQRMSLQHRVCRVLSVEKEMEADEPRPDQEALRDDKSQPRRVRGLALGRLVYSLNRGP